MGPSDETLIALCTRMGILEEDEGRQRKVTRALAETWPQIIEDTNHDMAEFNQAILLAVRQRFGSRTMTYVLQRAEEILNGEDS